MLACCLGLLWQTFTIQQVGLFVQSWAKMCGSQTTGTTQAGGGENKAVLVRDLALQRTNSASATKLLQRMERGAHTPLGEMDPWDYGKLLADEGATMQVLNEEQTANVGGRKNQINAKLKVFQSFSEVCVVPHK